MKELKTLVMRKLTWLVLIAYTLLIVKPVLPVFADVVAHTFWESQHMLTVHEVNGRFHVHQQLVTEAKQSGKEKHAVNYKVDMTEYTHVYPVAVHTSPLAYSYSVVTYGCYLCNYTLSNGRMDYPPPKHLATDNSFSLS